MNRNLLWPIAFLVLACVGGATAPACRNGQPAPGRETSPTRGDKPNFIFILADDLGWKDLGCQGSRFYETPHLDRLAEQGMRFTSAYTCGTNCSPTRACLMTGRYVPRHGIYTVGSGERGHERFRKLIPPPNVPDLALDEVTVAEVLRAEGYRTAMFGKWHLGKHHPSQHGFDEAIVASETYVDFVTDPPVEVVKGTYLTDFLTDQALRFIEANADRPFFLYLPHFAVHVPLHGKAELVAKYEKKMGGDGHDHAVYAAMVESLDKSVGLILEKLDGLGLSERTLAIFSSDNGGVGGYASEGLVSTRDITSNAPLRGGKGMFYEGGIRVPLILRWPGVVAPGTSCDVPIISVDLLPTLVELAGGHVDGSRPIDGESIVPLIRFGDTASWARDALFWHFPGYLQDHRGAGTWRTTPVGAIRQGDYKLLEFFEDGHIELYDLWSDIGETRDLAESLPDRAAELRRALDRWRQATRAPIPQRP